MCSPAAGVLHGSWQRATHVHPLFTAAQQQLCRPVSSSLPVLQFLRHHRDPAGCQGRISPAPFAATLATLTAIVPCRFVYESEMPVGRLVRQIADKAQVCTQRSWTRPYGVGLLVAGHDKSGAKLFYSCPSGNFYEYKAMAIGSRSQVSNECCLCASHSLWWHCMQQGQRMQLWALSPRLALC